MTILSGSPVHPNGKENKGRPALLDSETGEVLGGMGGKFNGKHISAVPEHGKNEQMGAQMFVNAKNHRADLMNGQTIPFQTVNNPANTDPANVDNPENKDPAKTENLENQTAEEQLNAFNKKFYNFYNRFSFNEQETQAIDNLINDFNNRKKDRKKYEKMASILQNTSNSIKYKQPLFEEIDFSKISNEEQLRNAERIYKENHNNYWGLNILKQMSDNGLIKFDQDKDIALNLTMKGLSTESALQKQKIQDKTLEIKKDSKEGQKIANKRHSEKLSQILNDYKKSNPNHTPEQRFNAIRKIVQDNKDPNGYFEHDIQAVGSAYSDYIKDKINNLKGQEYSKTKEQEYDDLRKKYNNEKIKLKNLELSLNDNLSETKKAEIQKQISEIKPNVDKLQEEKRQSLENLMNVSKEIFKQNVDFMTSELGKHREMTKLSDSQIKQKLVNSKTSKATPHFVNGVKVYPQAWIDKMEERGKVNLKTTTRGFFREDPSGIDLVCISGYTDQESMATAIHELGHRLEKTFPNIRNLEEEFYNRRTEGEYTESLRQVTKNKGYRSNEITRKDNFISPYMGKEYGGTGYYELVSMGFQYYFTEPKKLMKDPDMFNFISGILLTI